jgi:hypothetical protein
MPVIQVTNKCPAFMEFKNCILQLQKLIISQFNSDHVFTSYFCRVHFNIIFVFSPDLPSGLFPLGVPNLYFVYVSCFKLAC